MRTNRRSFFRRAALGTFSAMGVHSLLTSCTTDGKPATTPVSLPEILDQAPDGKPLKAGLVGCGGRGLGAAMDFLSAGNYLTITAIGDVFEDKVQACRIALNNKGQNLSESDCHTGFDAYKKVIDSDVDVVLLCTPPVFRPDHYDYVVQKGKHCFMEKPAGVDPIGAQRILATAKRAEHQDLSVISGMIYRSQKDCIETYRRVAGGAIGDIVSAHVTRHGSALWQVKRKPEWCDMEYVLRNWVNFCWTSGDFIVEQFIHEIDTMSWFMGDQRPVRVEATGGRQRRETGDMFDFFSMEYIYKNGMRTHCTSRQINGCDNRHSVMVYGTKGFTNCFNKIYNPDGTVAWEYPYPKADDPDQSTALNDSFRQLHVRLVTAIRTGTPVNDAEHHVKSTLMAIMGRMSAYSGKYISWDEMMASTMRLGPDTFKMGDIPGFSENYPKAGSPVS